MAFGFVKTPQNPKNPQAGKPRAKTTSSRSSARQSFNGYFNREFCSLTWLRKKEITATTSGDREFFAEFPLRRLAVNSLLPKLPFFRNGKGKDYEFSRPARRNKIPKTDKPRRNHQVLAFCPPNPLKRIRFVAWQATASKLFPATGKKQNFCGFCGFCRFSNNFSQTFFIFFWISGLTRCGGGIRNREIFNS